jgi:hypothetical protein
VQQSGLTYEQFMQLGVEKRLERFKSLSAEDRAAFKQTHARRWLEANRSSLNQRQIELVNDAISFLLSADRYSNPPDGAARKHQDELLRRLSCELGRNKVTAAFTFLDPPRWSWIDSADEWLAWFPDCVLPSRMR